MSRREGYTLIELVVVLAVLAVAAAVAVPAVGPAVDDLTARAEVAGVAGFLRLARARAAAQQRAYEVVLDSAPPALWLRPAAPAPAGSGVEGRPLSARVRVVVEPGAAEKVTFLPHGRSSGGSLRVEVGARVYTVTVDPLTGRVSTQRRHE